MSIRAIIHVVSLLVALLGLAMFGAAAVGLYYGDSGSVIAAMSYCALVTFLIGGTAIYLTRRQLGEQAVLTGTREGFASVGLGWIIASIFGAFPFYFCARMRFYDAVFETASGLTTTGASIIEPGMKLLQGSILEHGIESLPKCVLFWRSTINLLGGLGIVFFVMLILPMMKLVKGRQLYNAEASGLKDDDEQLTPRLTTSVIWLLSVYAALTMLATVVYKLTGLTWFDAVCHSFSTVSTSGFSTHSESIAFHSNPLFHWSVIFFMLAASCNFALLIRSIMTRRFAYWKDEEFRTYILAILLSSVIIAGYLASSGNVPVQSLKQGESFPASLEAYLRLAMFHVVSLASTTGFAISDYTQWGVPAIVFIIFCLMFPCGCGGSTSGGIKYSRILVMFKHMKYEVMHCISPRTVQDIRLNGKRIDSDVVTKTLAFIMLYILLFLSIGGLLILVERCDMLEAFGSSIACLSNVGPGFGRVGPAGSFASLTVFSKLLLTGAMIVGRLELYTVLVLFCPSFWKR